MINVSKISDGSADTGRYWLTLAVTGTSDAILLPAGMMSISAAIHPAVGQTARIEYTLSSIASVAAETAKWLVWPLGDISSGDADSIATVATAIRGVASGATATLELVAR